MRVVCACGRGSHVYVTGGSILQPGSKWNQVVNVLLRADHCKSSNQKLQKGTFYQSSTIEILDPGHNTSTGDI